MVVDRAPDLDQALRDRTFGDDDPSPNSVQQLLFGHEPPVPFDEHAEHFERLRSEVDIRACAQQRATLEIERELAERIATATDIRY